MNKSVFLRVLALLTLFAAGSAYSQTNRVTIDALQTSFTGGKFQKLSPSFQFGHTIGEGDVIVKFSIVQDFSYCLRRETPPADSIIDVALYEGSVKVDHQVIDCRYATEPLPTLSYTPIVPGLKTLTVIATLRNGTFETSNGVSVRMFGVILDTALGRTVTTPFLPFTSRIFLGADALLADANIKLAQFIQRSLPFQLSAGVPYETNDKVVWRGKLYEALAPRLYPPGSQPPVITADGNQDASDSPDYRYIGPRLVTNLDYFNYREPTDAAVLLPPDYPAPPRGRSDLVISRNPQTGDDNVFEVTTAGRLDSTKPVPALDATGGTAEGVVQFTYAGAALLPSHTYTAGELVLSNGRIYEVVQGGTTAADIPYGLQQTTGQTASSGTALFTFIPSKVLKALLPYWKNDLVISNGNIYRVTVGGTIAAGGVGTGLSSTDKNAPETKPGAVVFRRVGEPFKAARLTNDPASSTPVYEIGDVFSSNGRIYKVTAATSPAPASRTPAPTPGPTPSSTDPYAQQQAVVQYTDNSQPAPAVTYQTITVQLVVPQFHRYTEINADYAGKALQQAVVYNVGETVVSNGHLFEVTVGGTMGPVGQGLDPERQTQVLGGLSFQLVGPSYKLLSTIHPFGDVPFPYASFDYSFPYSLKWSPSETIANHYSLFGPAGYYEEHSTIELLTRISDSKDRTNSSATLPISLLPPIDARAMLRVKINQPLEDRLVAAGTAVTITADVRDVNDVVRVVEQVQFFVDGVPLSLSDLTFPYTTQGPNHWTPTVAGTHILNAVAVDDKGNYSISPDVRVNVTDNQPFVRITTAGGSSALAPLVLQSGQTFLIQGIASGSGGDPTHITTLKILSDGNDIGSASVGTDGRFAFSFTPANASTESMSYQITARVQDVNNATATSNTIYLQVAPGSPVSPGPGSTPTPTPAPGTNASGKLANISTRGPVESGTGVMVAGFIVQGSAAKTVAIRGLGPSLTRFGVADALQDPTLSFRDANGNVLSFNDDWGRGSSAERDLLATNGLTPSDAREAALVTTVAPGRYTAILEGKTNGIGLVEVYDLTGGLTSRLVNISTRGKVEPGDNGAFIGGFIVQGTTPQRVLIRALGASLKTVGISDALADPTLELYRGSTKILSNDNWKSTQQQEIETTGAAPTSDRESAIVTILDPGSYSAVVRGKSNTTGVTLAEIYQLN